MPRNGVCGVHSHADKQSDAGPQHFDEYRPALPRDYRIAGNRRRFPVDGKFPVHCATRSTDGFGGCDAGRQPFAQQRARNMPPGNHQALANDELTGSPLRRFLLQHGDALKIVAPVYILFVIVLIASVVVLGSNVLTINYFNSLIVLALITALLGLGQGIVVISGGMDLSVGQAVTLCGVIGAGLSAQFGDAGGNMLMVCLVVLVVGAMIGFINAIGVVFLGIPAVIMTIGMNGILAGLTLLYTNGVPSGTAPHRCAGYLTRNGSVWLRRF